MKVAAIAQRLKEGGFKNVGGALEYAELNKALGTGVWAYVIPASEAASASRGTQLIEQRVTATFNVALVLSNLGARDKVSDAIAENQQLAINALLGWSPGVDDGYAPIEFAGSALISMLPSSLIWGLRFTHSYYVKKDVR